MMRRSKPEGSPGSSLPSSVTNKGNMHTVYVSGPSKKLSGASFLLDVPPHFKALPAAVFLYDSLADLCSFAHTVCRHGVVGS